MKMLLVQLTAISRVCVLNRKRSPKKPMTACLDIHVCLNVHHTKATLQDCWMWKKTRASRRVLSSFTATQNSVSLAAACH